MTTTPEHRAALAPDTATIHHLEHAAASIADSPPRWIIQYARPDIQPTADNTKVGDTIELSDRDGHVITLARVQ